MKSRRCVLLAKNQDVAPSRKCCHSLPCLPKAKQFGSILQVTGDADLAGGTPQIRSAAGCSGPSSVSVVDCCLSDTQRLKRLEYVVVPTVCHKPRERHCCLDGCNKTFAEISKPPQDVQPSGSQVPSPMLSNGFTLASDHTNKGRYMVQCTARAWIHLPYCPLHLADISCHLLAGKATSLCRPVSCQDELFSSMAYTLLSCQRVGFQGLPCKLANHKVQKDLKRLLQQLKKGLSTHHYLSPVARDAASRNVLKKRHGDTLKASIEFLEPFESPSLCSRPPRLLLPHF